MSDSSAECSGTKGIDSRRGHWRAITNGPRHMTSRTTPRMRNSGTGCCTTKRQSIRNSFQPANLSIPIRGGRDFAGGRTRLAYGPPAAVVTSGTQCASQRVCVSTACDIMRLPLFNRAIWNAARRRKRSATILTLAGKGVFEMSPRTHYMRASKVCCEVVRGEREVCFRDPSGTTQTTASYGWTTASDCDCHVDDPSVSWHLVSLVETEA